MTNIVMVPRVTSHVSKISSIASRNKTSFEKSTRDLPSIYSAEFSKTSGLDHLRKNLQTEGVSKGLQTLSLTLGVQTHLSITN